MQFHFLLCFFNSCSKEDDGLNLQDPITYQEFSKDIQLFDNTGNNSVVMRVSSDDKSLLELYSSDNFKVIPIQEWQKIDNALNEYYGEQDESKDLKEEMDDEIADFENEESSISFQIISKNLKTDIKNVAIIYLHPDDGGEKANWRYYTHYSQAGQNLEETAFIERHSFWRRVYFGMSYKAYSYSGWSTIVSEWRKLSNNESYEKTKHPCYQFKVRVKTKRSSAYTVSFDY